jgi:succinate dehydrogenase hydrophobic anchor subunit
MPGINGLFLSKSGLLLIVLAVCVIVPTALMKMGVENDYTTFFTNPFTTFSLIFIVGVLSFHKVIRANVIAATIMTGLIAVASYLYVYTLIL